jgi:hypothetical protein
MGVRASPAVTINVSLFFILDVINFSFSKMTWCSKIYDIFNGWNEEENEVPSTKITNLTAKIKRINSDFYRHEIVNDNNTAIIQHDSPFLERSDSLTNAHFTNGQLYNTDYLNRYRKIFTVERKT